MPTPDLDSPSLLDPVDFEAFRSDAHEALDAALDALQQRQQAAVWQPLPEAARFPDADVPTEGTTLPELVRELQTRVFPYTLGNTHPRFWGWVHGNGTPQGLVAQLMVAAINANMGGREHAPIYLEKQVLRWWLQLFGMPARASGIFCTGTSSATLTGLCIARCRVLGEGVRRSGNPDGALLRAYTSEEAHGSVAKAMEVMGLGSQALVQVPVDGDYRFDTAALEAAVQADIKAGHLPFAVVSSVGSVNTGAIDDLAEISRICRTHGLWHHVDGAFGALAMLAPALRPRLAGIERADSIAFDFHKWLHVTYAAGCLLVADGDMHLKTFQTSPAYLQADQRGIAAGAPWPHDYGLELSRGFNALAVWFQMREQGIDRLGEAIHRNCLQAEALAEAVTARPGLALLAPVALNVVVFRYDDPQLSASALNQLNRRIVVALQERGIAAPSSTSIKGHLAIRLAITNHRTRWRDLEALVEAVPRVAAELCAADGGAPGYPL